MENFIGAKLRIITQEQHLRRLGELVHQLEVKGQLYEFLETEGCTSNDILLTLHTIQIYKYKVVGHHGPLQDQEGMLPFFGARRMLLLMVEQVFLPTGRSGRCITQIHNER